jgi:hypothetical protein
MRIATIAAPIGFANVGNYGLGVVVFDLECSINASSASVVRTSDRFPCLKPTIYSVMMRLSL